MSTPFPRRLLPPKIFTTAHQLDFKGHHFTTPLRRFHTLKEPATGARQQHDVAEYACQLSAYVATPRTGLFVPTPVTGGWLVAASFVLGNANADVSPSSSQLLHALDITPHVLDLGHEQRSHDVSYQASPMYQSQYPPYGQHYTPPAETEPQGAWFYLPHANPMPSPQQYDGGQPYYPPVTYAPIGPQDDGSYGPGPSPSTANPSAHTEPALPSVQRFSLHAVGGHTTLDSPRASGAGPPAAPAAASISSGSAGPPPITDKLING
ncbi:hypothetical protein NLJ89_g9358 [Agrocybe chaxingu]|uniref:Uncharacterized protein n=1 Tax=Agrocybe chaxingu TaxID=84603 RepID=A0A9W8JSL0_9AGAR|nr:hypothetical protein NLJ89_g9358 [Agrocybe chaxingu]